MIRSPNWVKRTLGRIGSPWSPRRAPDDPSLHASRPTSRCVGNAESTEALWDDFANSHAIEQLLSAKVHSDALTPTMWQDQLRTACRLIRDLEAEAKDEDELDSCRNQCFGLMLRLVKGAYYEQNGMLEQFYQEPRHFFVLHATAGLTVPLPASFCDAVLDEYVEQLQEAHPMTGLLPLAMVCMNDPQALFGKILSACPEAANLPTTTRDEYPLHLACRRLEWSTGLQDLVRAAPHVLHKNDPNGTSVFAMTGSLVEKRSVESIETLFEILRHDPGVLKNYIQGV